ncbi:hypothetical protein [uncultured Methylovirgula sp.]|uniref:hypothetical protein n=1 Tax=uncultured Methylovirgula sp. TaxID=1285960 RepID=UPI002622AB9C|nr:hypothetical protein [uncultured Methylovirgula sp.]
MKLSIDLRHIAKADLDVSETGRRVLTVYTPLSIVSGSADFDQFRILQAELLRFLEPLVEYDEIRIRSLRPEEAADPVVLRTGRDKRPGRSWL